MPRIFVNYRTGDEEMCAVLVERELSKTFGSANVFLASKSIPPGARFGEQLLRGVWRSDALIAVIGSRWLDARNVRGEPALGSAEDWVRREIIEAFSHDVIVIPLLVGGVARLKRENLPAELADLAEVQYIRFDHRNPDVGLRELRQRLAELDGARAASSHPPAQPPKPLPIPLFRPRTQREERPAETARPDNREPSSSTPRPPALSSSVRALVQEVGSALAKDEIERADVLTTLALLEAAGRSDSGWLRASDSRGLPDALFTELNAAWARVSGGAWGFDAQRKRIDGLELSAPGGFRRLLAAFGWGGDEDGIVPYAEFTQRGSRSAPFYPTLRNPARERSHREWDDEWSAMVISVYDRLQAWEP